MCFAFPFCNFFHLPQTKQLCLHLMDQRTNVTFAVIGAIKKTQCHWLIICWDHNTQHTGCAWAIFVFCLAWLMFPPPIPLWGSYSIPLGKQLLSSPHSEKGLWSKHFITRQWNIVDLCSRTHIILLSKCVAPDTRTVSESQNLVFPLRCSIIYFPFVWAMWNGVLCNEFFTDFCRAN